MTKTIFATLIAATALSNVAFAGDINVPASGKCSEVYDQVSRFNPSELSDYGKCVAIANDMDHGTVGNYIWIRTGEGSDSAFTYVEKEDLKGKSQGDAIKFINNEVFNTVVDAALQRQLDELTAERATLLASIGTANADIDGLEDDIVALNGRISTLRMQVAALDPTTNDAAAIAAARGRALAGLTLPAGTAGFDAERGNTHVDGSVSVAGTYGITSVAPVATHTYSIDFSAGYPQHIVTEIATGARTTHVSQLDAFAAIGAGVVFTSSDGRTYVVDANERGTTVVTGGFDTIAVGGVSAALEGVAEAIQTDIVAVVNAAYAEGYKAGYDRGFGEGYADGYADGFADGVASVRE